MKKTISVNISGFIFNIEEDAYEVMLEYLNNLKAHLKKTEGGDEIYQDIEARIAELFQQKLNDSKEVVNEEDVDEVIGIIGKPEEYLFEEDEMSEESNTSESKSTTSEDFEYEAERRVFRDTDHSVIGGVCSGIARYFDIDPILIRLAFAILFFGFGTGILLYIILWIIIPEAKTNADKLKMRGKSVNMENLKSQFENVKKNPKRKKEMHRTAEFAKDVGSNFLAVFSKFVGGAIIVSVIFFLIFMFSVTIGEMGMFTDENGESSVTFFEFSQLIFASPTQAFFGWLGVVFVSIIPLMGLVIFGVQLVFSLKSKYTKIMGISLGVIWAMGVGILTIVGMQVARDFTHYEDFEDEVYRIENVDEIYVDVSSDEYFSDYLDYKNLEFTEMIQVHDDEVLLGYPKLSVHSSPDTNYHVIAVYSSRGPSNKKAIDKAENIDYVIKKEGTKIWFNPYFKFPKEDKFRNQEIEVVVQVPAGKKITFGPNCTRMLGSFDEERDLKSNRVNKTYEMRGKELILAD